MTILVNTSIEPAPAPAWLATTPVRLRHRAPSRQWIIALCALATLTLLTSAAVIVAGDELSAQAAPLAEWWSHRSTGLVLGIVALLTALSGMLAMQDRRADADKPVYDIR